MPPALGAPAPVRYIPSPNLMTPSGYLDQVIYSAAGEPVPAAAPAPSTYIPGSTYIPPEQAAPAGDPYATQGGYATEPVGGNDTYYATAPTGETYRAQAAPAGGTYSLTPYDPSQPPPTQIVGYQEQAPQYLAGAPAQDPYGPSGDTLNVQRGSYGAFEAAQPLPASGANNLAPIWDAARSAPQTAQNAATWIGQELGILPRTTLAQTQIGRDDEIGGGGPGGGGGGARGTRGVGRPIDSEPGGVRGARQGMTPGSVRVGDSLTVNPAQTTASLPSSTPIGTGRRVINTSGTANPQAGRNRGQIEAGARALGDPYARMPTGTTPASTSIPGYTVATGNPSPARGVTGTTPAGRAALPTGTTAFPPLPFTPTMGVPGLNTLTPKQIGAGLAGLAGLGAGATFGPAFIEDVRRREVAGADGESTFVPGADYGPRAPWPTQGQRVGSTSARDQGDVRASALQSAGIRDAAWTTGTRDYLEDRDQTAPRAVDPYATNTTGGTPSGAATPPVVNAGDVSRNRAAKLLTPDLEFIDSERTSDAFAGGTGSYSLRVIHGDSSAPLATDALVTPRSMAAAQEAGMVPWMLDETEFASLVEAGLIPESAKGQVVGTPLLIPAEWATVVGATGDTLTDPQAVDPYTAPATGTSSGGGSGWVDYGNSGGGGGGYRRRSYGGGGGGGYSRSYGGGGGYSGGGGFDGGFGGMDMSWLPEGFGGEDGFMEGAFDSPIFARYFDVLSRHMGEERASSLLQGMRGMKRGFRRSKRTRSRSMPGGRTLTTKGPRQSSVNEGLNVPSNDSVRKDVGKQITKSTKKDKDA